MADESMTNARSKFSGFGNWSLVILVLLAFALRIYNLGKLEFWFDEALSANISALGWEGIVAHLRSQPFEHPPLYFLALYPWQQLVGTSEFAFRFFSVFWGVLFVPLLYALVKKLADRRLGLLAALLATVSPFMVAYSQDARMYSLLPVLAVLVLLAFHNALEREGQPVWWLVYALLLTIGVTTHYFFVLIWAAMAVYLAWEWPRRRKGWLWGVAVQLLILVGGTIWFAFSPGLRSSLAVLAQGETAFSLAYKLNKVMPTLMLGEVAGGQVPAIANLVATAGWILVLVGAWWALRTGALEIRAWRLLALVLVIPLALSLLVPYGVLGRHLGYTLVPVFAFVALGLLACAQSGRFWAGVGIVAVLLFTVYGLVVQFTKTGGDFGQALAYVDEQGQPGDMLVLTQPGQRHLMDYYNEQAWPVRYVPEPGDWLNPEGVDSILTNLEEAHPRLWLGPIGAWTADPERLVEQWLSLNAFQAEKTWFPESSSVALYFNNDKELENVELGRLTWGGLIRLRQLHTSPLQVAPGDAVRLDFQWRSGLDLDSRYQVSLLLVDEQGQVWAERRSEPCGGWCPTDEWRVGQLQQDQHALLIPPGTPPGSYHLQVAWTPLDGGPPLAPEQDRERVEQINVAEVTVLRPQAGLDLPGELPNPLDATFGNGVTLLGYEAMPVELRPGETLHLALHWRAEAELDDDYDLVLELMDREGNAAASWQVPPSAGFYPTSEWQPGEYLRGQHDLLVPSAVAPDRYQLTASLVSANGERLPLSGERPRQGLGGLFNWQERLDGQELLLAEIRLSDRPRLFELPEVTNSLVARVGQQAHLVGYDLDLSQAHPGGQLHLTLYWQAGGPMIKPFKVFTHLVDAEGALQAQHDALPGGGCCPPDTWAEGEVIVDQHTISLGADLPPGTYELVAGMYDEDTATRVPAYDGQGNPLLHERIPISVVNVEPVSAEGEETTVPLRPQLDFDYLYFLPAMFNKSR